MSLAVCLFLAAGARDEAFLRAVFDCDHLGLRVALGSGLVWAFRLHPESLSCGIAEQKVDEQAVHVVAVEEILHVEAKRSQVVAHLQIAKGASKEARKRKEKKGKERKR